MSGNWRTKDQDDQIAAEFEPGGLYAREAVHSGLDATLTHSTMTTTAPRARLLAAADAPTTGGLDAASEVAAMGVAVRDATDAMVHLYPVVMALRTWRDAENTPKDQRVIQRAEQDLLFRLQQFEDYASGELAASYARLGLTDTGEEPDGSRDLASTATGEPTRD